MVKPSINERHPLNYHLLQLFRLTFRRRETGDNEMDEITIALPDAANGFQRFLSGEIAIFYSCKEFEIAHTLP